MSVMTQREARPGPRGRPKGTGSQAVYQDLRRRILRIELVPGSDLDEQGLVAQYELSRTPVREALIRLASEGLVELIPNRGPRVAAFDLDEVPEIFDALEIGLRVTARWAAIRHRPEDMAEVRRQSRLFAETAAADDFHGMSEANRDYHLAIARAAGNRHFVRMLDTLLAITLRYAYVSLSQKRSLIDRFPGGFPQIIDEHEDLIRLIEARDADGADRLSGQHTRMFRAKVIEALNASLAGSTPVDFVDERIRHRG